MLDGWIASSSNKVKAIDPTGGAVEIERIPAELVRDVMQFPLVAITVTVAVVVLLRCDFAS